MKKFFLIAAAAAMVLSSCSKNTVSEDTSDVNAIGFGTYSGRATKAGASLTTTTTIPDGSEFGVYSYVAQSWTSSLKPTFMTNQMVHYAAGSPDKYTYDPLRYWPKNTTNYKLSFFAYYPYTSSANTSTTGIEYATMPTATTEGQGSFIFTVQGTAANQVDFMVSDLVKDLTYDNAGNALTAPEPGSGSDDKGLVKLQFHHMLAQINAKVTATCDAKTRITVKSITFKKIANKATLTMAPVATSSPALPTDCTWGTATGSADYVMTLDPSNVAINGGSTNLVTKQHEGTLLMIPQSFSSDDQEVVIEYSYATKISDSPLTYGPEIEESATAELKGTTSWAKNNNIVYNFNINLTTRVIRFTAAVTDWDAESTINLNTL